MRQRRMQDFQWQVIFGGGLQLLYKFIQNIQKQSGISIFNKIRTYKSKTYKFQNEKNMWNIFRSTKYTQFYKNLKTCIWRWCHWFLFTSILKYIEECKCTINNISGSCQLKCIFVARQLERKKTQRLGLLLSLV